MLNFDQRFFRFDHCLYKKSANVIVLFFLCRDNYENEIPRLEKSVTKQVLDELDEDIKVEFEYQPDDFVSVPQKIDSESLKKQLEELKASDSVQKFPSVKTDKTLKMTEPEYFLGRPVNMRPIKIKFLKVSKDDQVTGGTIFSLKKREYKRADKESGEEVVKPYWTFTLDDGESQIQCVFFPSQKTYQKFEKLQDRTVICAIGTCENFRDQKNFRVSGISLCEF